MGNKSMAHMSGEENFNQSPKLPLNVIRFNGKKGRFSLIKLLEPKQKTDKGDRHVEEDLGERVSVVFLKVRRKLVEKRTKKPEAGDPKIMSTNEHNSKEESVLLYKDKGVDFGNTDVLKPKYPALRTQQVVYAIWNGQVVRVNFKGAALGSNAKGKDVHDFYSYISSFEKNPEARDKIKDHFYDFATNLLSIEEVGELGEYYTVTFGRGESLNEEDMNAVKIAMQDVFQYTQSLDAFYKSKIELLKSGAKIEVAQEIKVGVDTGYPDEDIDPEDIPF